MNPKLQQYVKVFFLMGVPMGAFMLLMDNLDGEGIRWLIPVFQGLFFGLFMSLIFVTIQIAHLRKAGDQKITSDDFKTVQKRVFQSDISQGELIVKLKDDPSFKKMELTESGNQIFLKSKTSFQSWGENIVIRIKSNSTGLNVFDVISKPRLKVTIVDSGVNYQNVRNLEKLIMKTA